MTTPELSDDTRRLLAIQETGDLSVLLLIWKTLEAMEPEARQQLLTQYHANVAAAGPDALTRG